MILPADVPHKCEPPKWRPRSEWETIGPPLAFMKPEDRARAKPVPIPTGYPKGSLWRCPCGTAWVVWRDIEGTFWRRVGWWNFRLKKRLQQGDFEAMAADPYRWAQDRIDEIVEHQ